MAAASSTIWERKPRSDARNSTANEHPAMEAVTTDEQALQGFIAENIQSCRTCLNHPPCRNSLPSKVDMRLKSSIRSCPGMCGDLMTGTEAFGKIHFRSYERARCQSLPPYIKLCSETEPEALANLLKTFWKLHAPSFMVSLIGSTEPASDATLNVRRLMRDFIKVCLQTGAWMCTNGTTSGISRIAGCEMAAARREVESRKQKRLVLLGVAPWLIIRNKLSLVNTACLGLQPAFYDDEPAGKGFEISDSGTHTLDANHTHIILYEDAAASDTLSATPEYTRFQEHLQAAVASACKDVSTPTVHVLLGGNCVDLTNALLAVRAGMPLIAFEKTGGTAELLAKSYRMMKDDDWNDRSALRSFLRRISPVMRKTIGRTGKKLKGYIVEILTMRNLVNIIPDSCCSSDVSTDYAILSALKNYSKIGNDKLLKLATMMNRHDFVEHELLESQTDSKTAANIHEVLVDCLVSNKHHMVQVLLKRGIEPLALATKKDMEQLYTKTMAAKGRNTQRLLIQILIGRVSLKCKPKSGLLSKIGDLVARLFGGNDCLFKDGEILQSEATDSLVAKHLLVWATLFARSELAEYFWRTGTDHLGTSVLAYRISSKLGQYATNEHMDVLSSQYQSLATYFERKGCEVLQTCYDRDAEITLKCITRKIDCLGGNTVMRAADYAHHPLIGHVSCQMLLRSIWTGKMDSDSPPWKLILAFFLPPAFLPLLQFKMEENRSTTSTSRNCVSNQTSCCASSFSAKVSQQFPQDSSTFVRETTPGSCQENSKLNLSTCRRRVGLYSDATHSVNYFTALRYFFEAPVTKYAYHTVSHVAFVVTFAIFLLTELSPISDTSGIQVLEIMTWIWCLSLTLEEMRQVIESSGVSLRQKYARWWSNLWNKVDAAQNLLFIVGVILRFTLKKENFLYSRLAYTMSLTLFFLRSIQLLFVFKTIGLKMILMGRMFWDLVFFTFVLSVFLVCFGVAYSGLLYPQGQLDKNLLSKVVYDPYRVVLGQLPFDDLSTSNSSVCVASKTLNNYTEFEDCPIPEEEAGRNLALYYLVANVLVINLLMALFRAQSIQQHPPERIWQYSRYSLVYEISQRPALPCPLNLLSVVFRVGSKIQQAASGNGNRVTNSDFVTRLTEEETRQVQDFEADAAKHCNSNKNEPQHRQRLPKQPRKERSEDNDAITNNTQHKALEEIWNERLYTIHKQYSELQLRLDYIAESLKPVGSQQCGGQNRMSTNHSRTVLLEEHDDLHGNSACESDTERVLEK